MNIYILKYLHYLMFVVKQMSMTDHSNFEPAVVVIVVTKTNCNKNLNIIQSLDI